MIFVRESTTAAERSAAAVGRERLGYFGYF